MKKTNIARLLSVYLATSISGGALWTQAATAAESNLAVPEYVGQASVEFNAALMAAPSASFASWLPQLLTTFNQLPETVAQQARINQVQWQIEAADQAIYNPELGLSYQNAKADDTYTLEISQTIDWGDKRGVATRMAQLQHEILLNDIALERSQMLSVTVLALVEQAQNTKLLEFQQQQLSTAKQQLRIAQQRQKVGDLSVVELQLIQLDVANKAAQYAMAELASIDADAQVLMQLGDSEQAFAGFLPTLLEAFLGLDNNPISSPVGPDLLALKSAYQQVMLARVSANQVKADNAADPSISLSAEREGDENKLGFGISIPLQFRNTYSQAHAAANEGIAIAEQAYLARERVLTQQQKLFYLSMPRLSERYGEWHKLVLTSSNQARIALTQQWRAGDIETAVYLQSQRQVASSFLAGLTLETALYRSWLEWMGVSGQLETYLNQQLATPVASTRVK